MRIETVSVAALLTTLASCHVARQPRVSVRADLAIRAAGVLDPASGVITRDVVVLVRGDRIAGVIPRRALDTTTVARVIDVGNAMLLPGLIDAHVHLTIGGPPKANAAAILSAGFTTVADLGAVSHRVLRLRDSIALGAIPGPRVLAAGLWIGVKNGVCEFGGIGISGGPDAFIARVRENLDAGANLIKVCVTGWPNEARAYPDSVEMSNALLASVVQAAHAAGRRVVAHALSAGGVRAALDAGVDGLAHAAFVDEALAARMKARGMWMIPTLASLTAADTSVTARELVHAVQLAHRAGVSLVFGTDGGVLPHGRNVDEADALVAAGIPPLDVLRAATVNAARALGIADSVGAVREGMIADLIAVEGDPVAEVSALRHVVLVVSRGVVMRSR
jgi:imidazolonepropionase-like amidohydrolase